MRVTIIATGTRGDVQPLVALGIGLQQAGHRVRFATEASYADSVTSADLQYHEMTGNSKAFHSGRAGIRYREIFTSPRAVLNHDKFLKSFAASMWVRRVREHLQEMLAPCEDADVLLCQPWNGTGPSLGEKFQVPSIVAGVFPVPQLPTQEFPCPWHDEVSDDMTDREVLQSWDIWPEIWRLGAYSFVQEWRKNVLGLSEQGVEESLADMQNAPHILGYSPLVLPKPAEWGDQVDVTGFWFLKSSSNYQPPSELEQFLADGDPPVVIGFSSHVGRNPERLTRLVVEALMSVRKRGILIQGWGVFPTSDLPKEILSAQDVPYDWLLPRAQCLVHHGGAGTMAIAMRCGIPQVITTFGWDQAFWGLRAAKLGVSAAPLDSTTVTAEQLATAISHVTTNADVRSHVEKARVSMCLERGVEAAVAAIERFAK